MTISFQKHGPLLLWFLYILDDNLAYMAWWKTIRGIASTCEDDFLVWAWWYKTCASISKSAIHCFSAFLIIIYRIFHPIHWPNFKLKNWNVITNAIYAWRVIRLKLSYRFHLCWCSTFITLSSGALFLILKFHIFTLLFKSGDLSQEVEFLLSGFSIFTFLRYTWTWWSHFRSTFKHGFWRWKFLLLARPSIKWKWIPSLNWFKFNQSSFIHFSFPGIDLSLLRVTVAKEVLSHISLNYLSSLVVCAWISSWSFLFLARSLSLS